MHTKFQINGWREISEQIAAILKQDDSKIRLTTFCVRIMLESIPIEFQTNYFINTAFIKGLQFQLITETNDK